MDLNLEIGYTLYMQNVPSIPVVSAIIERKHNDKTQVLIQTRWKPQRDPVYSGTIEIAAGVIDEYENVYEALKREVYEETGLSVIKIHPYDKTIVYKTTKDDGAFGFRPFCCFQQLRNGRPWIGFAFICEVDDKEPTPQEEEVRDIKWINKEELQRIFTQTPDKIFSLQLGVLDYYFKLS